MLIKTELINLKEAVDALLKEADSLKANGLTGQSLGMGAAATAVMDLPEAPSAQPPCSPWHPTRDSQPEKSGRYLVNGKRGRVYINNYDCHGDRWYGGVIPLAWMELPDPIGEEKE